MVGKEDLNEGRDTEDTEDEVGLPLDVPECYGDELESRVRSSVDKIDNTRLTKARAKFMIQFVAVARPAAFARTGRGLHIGVRADRSYMASVTYKISEM